MIVSALVAGIGTADGIARYLPEDWRVVTSAERRGTVLALIEGEDSGAWGFDNYVKPRLGSGSYGVYTVSPDAGYAAVSTAAKLAREG